MRIFLLFLFLSSGLHSQERKDIFYFSSTGDTIIGPIYSVGDSTFLSIYKFVGAKIIELKKIAVFGFDNYRIPQGILTTYNLKVKGQKILNEKRVIFINEKVISNRQIGLSNDFSKYLFRTKIKISVEYKGKVVLNKYSTEQDYDAKEKKDFSKETYFEPIIIKMENKEIYFVTLSPRVYFPDMGTRIWSLLVEPDYLHYFGLKVQ